MAHKITLNMAANEVFILQIVHVEEEIISPNKLKMGSIFFKRIFARFTVFKNQDKVQI